MERVSCRKRQAISQDDHLLTLELRVKTKNEAKH